MRENIKSVGLILAIAIASVSLPIGIMGFNKGTINNYYTNNYYTTNNNTTIINGNTTIDEPELKPLYVQDYTTFFNLTDNPDWFYDVSYNLTEGYEVFFKANSSDYFGSEIFIIQSYLFEIWDSDRSRNIYEKSISFDTSVGSSGRWLTHTSGNWYFCFRYEHAGGTGVDITIEITYCIMI